jgi:hypothetical protein
MERIEWDAAKKENAHLQVVPILTAGPELLLPRPAFDRHAALRERLGFWLCLLRLLLALGRVRGLCDRLQGMKERRRLTSEQAVGSQGGGSIGGDRG